MAVLWCLGIGAGFGHLARYENTPGPVGEAPVLWPGETAIPFAADRLNVVMLVHPKCACSRASLHELKALVEPGAQKLVAHVLFLIPENAGPDWRATDLWQYAAALPNTCLHADAQGTEAKRFGATTSGHVLVFDGQGRRLFSGGLTNSRGQTGNSTGVALIKNLADQPHPARSATPTFGCPLFQAGQKSPVAATANSSKEPAACL